MKNEKFLLDIQTKCGNIANKILNVAIDTERTFKCKWPYTFMLGYHYHQSEDDSFNLLTQKFW